MDGELGQELGALKKAGIPTQTVLHLNRLHKLCILLYVVHDSAALKGGGDIQNFWEGGRTLHEGDLAFYGGGGGGGGT